MPRVGEDGVLARVQLRIKHRTRRRRRAIVCPQATDRRRYGTHSFRTSGGYAYARIRRAEHRGNQAYRSGRVSPSRKAERSPFFLPSPLDSLGDDLAGCEIKPVPRRHRAVGSLQAHTVNWFAAGCRVLPALISKQQRRFRPLLLSRASESPPTAGACTDPANGRPFERSKQQSRRRRRSVPHRNELGHLACANHTSALSPFRSRDRHCCFGRPPTESRS